VTSRKTFDLGFKALALAARIRTALGSAGPIVRTTPLLGAVVVLAALAAIPHGGPTW
jgi:hypothetical protein